MSAASDYLEAALLNHTLRNTAYTSPTTVYLALFENTSTNAAANLEAGILTDEISEVTAGFAYARQVITFDAPSGGACDSAATVTFPTASGGDWGTITHVAVMDGTTEGADNVLFWGAVTTPKLIEDGDTFQVTAGNLTVTLA